MHNSQEYIVICGGCMKLRTKRNIQKRKNSSNCASKCIYLKRCCLEFLLLAKP